MQRSDTIAELAAALSQAQAAIGTAKQSGLNPAFKSKYASLTDVWEAVRPPLTANGLALVQTFTEPRDQWVTVITTLLHKSGEWIQTELGLPAAQNTAQAFGSAITYARRYSIAAMLGVVADDDDDGAQASVKPAQAPARKPETANGAADPREKRYKTLHGLLKGLGVDVTDKALRHRVADAMLDLAPGSTGSLKEMTDRALDELCDRLREMTPASMSVVLDAIKARETPQAEEPDPFADETDEERADREGAAASGVLLDAPRPPAATRH